MACGSRLHLQKGNWDAGRLAAHACQLARYDDDDDHDDYHQQEHDAPAHADGGHTSKS